MSQAILIVDDTPEGADAAAGLCEMGYDCELAVSVLQAELMLRKRPFDLVIHDLNTGAMETIRRWGASMCWGKPVKIVVVSRDFPDLAKELKLTDAGALMCRQKLEGVAYITMGILVQAFD